MGEKVSIVWSLPDIETITAAAKLKDEAAGGDVIGLAFVALHRGGIYSGDVVGYAKSHPIYTLGLIEILQQRLHSLTSPL